MKYLLQLLLLLLTTPIYSQAVIPGLSHEGLSPELRGAVLFNELNCASCHAVDREKLHLPSKSKVHLQEITSTLDPSYIEAFLKDPSKLKPGTTMPRVLTSQRLKKSPGVTVDQAAKALTHYLRSLNNNPFERQVPNKAAVKKGRELFHSIGCVACHAPKDAAGKTIEIKGSVPQENLEAKFSVNSLAAFIENPLHSRPSGRMPSLSLSPNEAFQIANYLLQNTKIEKKGTFTPNAELVTLGQKLFDQLDCTSCHVTDSKKQSTKTIAKFPAAEDLNTLKGCLGPQNGNEPQYTLSANQRKDLEAFLSQRDKSFKTEDQILASLASHNCLTCHSRGKVGGMPLKRTHYFTSLDENMGETGRLPPPLTGVGAKLQPKWLARTVEFGQSLRPYMSLRMPQFGKTTHHLPPLLATVDKVEKVDFPAPPKGRNDQRALRDMGRKLVGDQGLSCISCHTFRSESAGGMKAIDIVEKTTERLNKDWFYHYMLHPPSFRPETIMPQFFEDGKSTLDSVADGDPKVQLHAIWYYLSEGRNVGAPRGLRREPMEIVVKDEAIILRRSAQNTGKRGINVGYPSQIHLTFDAESISMDQIWTGQFIDPGGVWRGQGSGRTRIMSRNMVRLGKGPSFAQLKDSNSIWPEESSRDLGIRFKGYELDKKRRPKFLYRVRDVEVSDYLIDSQKTLSETKKVKQFERSLRLKSPQPQSLYFRVALNKDIQSTQAHEITLEKRLKIRAFLKTSRGKALEKPQAIPILTQKSEGSSQAIIKLDLSSKETEFVLQYEMEEAQK